MENESNTCCALCFDEAPLQESHILPAFVFRWLRESSATGHFRFAQTPNKRVQDGLKLPLLCAVCEGRLSQYETAFATKLFHPWNAESGKPIQYDDWLLKFCVSISWRVLNYFKNETGLTNFDAEQQNMAVKALDRWSKFILGHEPHPSIFEQHILPLDPIESHSLKELPININRYILRGVDMDVPADKKSAYTYAKIGKILIFGFIQPPSNKWIGSKIHLRNGKIEPREYVLPTELMEYISFKADRYGKIGARISDKQQDKIEADAIKNPDRFQSSGTLDAMLHDLRMFGPEAIRRRTDDDEVDNSG